MHALTIDVEGFCESHAESVAVDASLCLPAVNDREIAANLDCVLDLLDETDVQATFFFLGRIARTAPELVRRVAEPGHEIGCHSLEHRRISGQRPEEFRRDIIAAKAGLEDACGQQVMGFRAPHFSIGARNRWAIDELMEAGFLYDSSIVPTRLHDVYGMSGTPETAFRWHNGLVEFPLPVVHWAGFAFPIGGGGYFRLYPLMLTRCFFRRETRSGRPAVFYIHPYEIGPVAPRLPGFSLPRRFRHYVRLGKGRKRLRTLLQSVEFTTMARVLAAEGFLPHSGKW